MIEEDSKIEPREFADDKRYGETLLYDLGKFLTTLSLLAIGGVLTIADNSDRGDVKPFAIILISGILSLAAVLAASTAGTIAIGRWSGKPVSPQLHRYITATIALLGFGLGMFIFMWIDKLS